MIFETFASSWFGPPHLHAQAATRRLTTIDALRRFSSYFHLQNVVLRGELVEVALPNAVNGSTRPGGGAIEASGTARRLALRGGDSEMQVMLNDVAMVDGPVEVRAQLIDVGRLTPSDPRLGRYDNKPDPDHWPTPGEELILNVTSVVKAQSDSMPTIRSLALEPWRFDGQSVTVTGQFGGRNLFGDLPASPAKSKYDFVLKGAEGAVWVTGLRPKGKGFDLNVDARVDTSHWLQVTGPGEVVFSSPTEGETGVSPTAPIRVQFSRGIDPATLSGNLRISYVGGAAVSPDATAVAWSYDAATRAVTARFSKPPEPFRTMKVEVVEGVKTFDGAPVKPWSVTFSVGAN